MDRKEIMHYLFVFIVIQKMHFDQSNSIKVCQSQLKNRMEYYAIKVFDTDLHGQKKTRTLMESFDQVNSPFSLSGV